MPPAVSALLGVVFDGVAYGSLLFLISLGLSVTLGLMGFVNLAHGAFAMLGGFLCVALMRRWSIPFLATLPLVFLAVAAVGAVLEAALYRRLYRASPLDQVLFTIGLTFMAVAAGTRLFGPGQQPVELPLFLRWQLNLAGIDLGAYRLFLIVLVFALAAGLGWLVARTRFGARLRAAVDDRQTAAAMGVNVGALFSATFAVGSGLAGLGGALGIDVLGLDPTFAIKYLVYFLLVVAVGGAGSFKGPLLAALLLGVADVAGKYYVPQAGGFILYGVMVVLLILFPAGLHGRRA
jgi:branched-chain amino acid transport system permease protein